MTAMSTDVRHLTYTAIRDTRLTAALADLSHPDTALLQRIRDVLDAAGQDYTARRYQSAIAGYKQASTLIWSQMDPGIKIGPGVVGHSVFDPKLLSSLLQTSLTWLGVVPVPGPLSPVIPIGVGNGGAGAADHVGLTSPIVATPAALAAAGAARLAGIYTAQGSRSAGTELEQRALSLDKTVAQAVFDLPQDGGLAHRIASLFTRSLSRPAAPAGATAMTRLQATAMPNTPVAVPAPGLGAAAVLPGAGAPPAPAGNPAATASLAANLTEDVTVLPISLTQQRRLGLRTGPILGPAPEKIPQFDFTVGGTPDAAAVEHAVYAARVDLAVLPDVLAQPLTPGDFVVSLAHTLYYVIPVALGDCYAALGDWADAETPYLAAANYHYINTQIEAPQLWGKIATLYVLWADSFYRDGDAPSAQPMYERVVLLSGQVPTSSLYTVAGIGAGASVAESLIPNLAALIADPSALAAAASPAISTPLVDAWAKLGQIKAGLDFHGHWAPTVPIWTFDYLQQVAGQYAQLAVTVEQNVVGYWDRADQAQLTRLQLVQHVADSQAEQNAAQLQANAAAAEADAYQKGLDLANERAADAAANASDYQNLHGQAILYQAESSEVSGGDDGQPDYLNSLADQFQSGSTISGDRGDIAAAVQLVSSRLSMQYEVASMQRTSQEMQAAAVQAQAEVTAAQARVAAAQAQVALAQLHTSEAQAVLAAFDDQTFSAGVWKAMGDKLYALYRRYLDMALREAKLMQSAFNFENDTSVALIRPDYTCEEIQGLLAADQLQADIQSFTDTLLATRRTKIQPVTHVLSLASRHSYAFETQFRTGGRIAFDTTADDFDLAYPGTYGGRIRHVDVTVVGLTQPSGFSGTLTCGGLSFYRTPTDTWDSQDTNTMRRRVQSSETLVLSDFDRRLDPAALADQRQTGMLAGAGVIGSWVLDVPPEVNDLDYHLITDVLVSFTYDARYDPDLAAKVRQILDSQPGAHTTQIGLPLRWLYPDAFFDLVNSQTATVSIQRSDLPLNHASAQLSQVGLLVTTSGGHSPAALTVEVSAPGAASASAAVSDSDGLSTSTSAGSPLATQLGRPVVGDWTLSVPAAANPAWTGTSGLDLSSLANLTLLLEYTYTPRTSA